MHFFICGGEDISRPVASVCMIFSGRVNYTIMHIMTWAFVLHFQLKRKYFHFCSSNLLQIWVFSYKFYWEATVGNIGKSPCHCMYIGMINKS